MRIARINRDIGLYRFPTKLRPYTTIWINIKKGDYIILLNSSWSSQFYNYVPVKDFINGRINKRIFKWRRMPWGFLAVDARDITIYD